MAPEEKNEKEEDEGFLEMTWGKIKSVFSSVAGSSSGSGVGGASFFVPIEDTLKHVDAPAHVNVKGRGPPKHILTPRRQKDFAEILRYFVGLRYWEIFESQDMPYEVSNEELRTWQERVPSEVLHDGVEEDTRQVIADFLVRPPVGIRTGKYKYHPDDPVLLCEHMETHPLAYGVRGQSGTFVRFTRDGGEEQRGEDHPRFYNVPLTKDEPSPVVFDKPKMMYYYSKGFGLSLVIPEMKKKEYHDYVLTLDGAIFPVADTFMFGQLEPARVAKTPGECSTVYAAIKTGNAAIADLAYLRGTMDYKARIELPLRLLNEPVVLVSEAYGILTRMIQWSHEATVAMRGGGAPLSLSSTEMGQYRALGFVFKELQHAPWYSTVYYKFLFSEYGNPQSPFPDEAYLRVFGALDTCVSFLPAVYKKGEDSLFLFRKVSSKKKRNHCNQKEKEAIGDTDKDIRILSVPSMVGILERCGIPLSIIESRITERWDKTWNITKIASSHRGETILGGEIAKYARPDQKANRHNSDHAKKELAYVRRKIEQEDFFKNFRALTSITWDRLHRFMLPTPLAPKKDLTKEEEEGLDDFSAILGEQLFLKEDSSKEEDLVAFALQRAREAEARRRYDAWAVTEVLPLRREGWQATQAIPRVLSYTYDDDGVVTEAGQHVSIQYLVFPQARVSVGCMIPEEEEELLVILEEEEE